MVAGLLKTVLLFAVIQRGHGEQHQQVLGAESEVSLCNSDVAMVDSRSVVAFMTQAAQQPCWSRRYQFSNVGGNPRDHRHGGNDIQRCNFLAQANTLQTCNDRNQKVNTCLQCLPCHRTCYYVVIIVTAPRCTRVTRRKFIKRLCLTFGVLKQNL